MIWLKVKLNAPLLVLAIVRKDEASGWRDKVAGKSKVRGAAWGFFDLRLKRHQGGGIRVGSSGVGGGWGGWGCWWESVGRVGRARPEVLPGDVLGI